MGNNGTMVSTVSTNHSRVDVEVRRQLHFDDAADPPVFRMPPQYHRMSPQEIIAVQERKLKEKEEELCNMEEELNFVYGALDKVRSHRSSLYHARKSKDSDCLQQIQKVYDDFAKFRNQATELHQDLWDVANDDRERKQYER